MFRLGSLGGRGSMLVMAPSWIWQDSPDRCSSDKEVHAMCNRGKGGSR